MKTIPPGSQKRLDTCSSQYEEIKRTLTACILRGRGSVPSADREAAADALTRLSGDQSITHSPYVTSAQLPLRRIRRAAGLTQEEVASRVGVTRRSIYNFEQSGRVPRVETAKALAGLFGLNTLTTLGLCGAWQRGSARRTRDRLAATVYDPDRPLIGSNLRAARESVGLSQRELSARLGCNRKTLQGYEANRFRPRAWRQFQARLREILETERANKKETTSSASTPKETPTFNLT